MVVVVSVEKFDVVPGESSKDCLRIGANEVSLPKFTSVRIRSGVVLAKDVDDERREVEDGGGGIGFGVDVCVMLESALEDIDGFAMVEYTIKENSLPL